MPLLSPTHHAGDLRAAHMAILAHRWDEGHPWRELVLRTDEWRSRVLTWASHPPGGVTRGVGNTKAGRPLGKWLGQIVPYVTLDQLRWLVSTQGGRCGPELEQFARDVHQLGDRIASSTGPARARAPFSVLEEQETRVVRRLIQTIQTQVGHVSVIWIADGLYAVPYKHLTLPTTLPVSTSVVPSL